MRKNLLSIAHPLEAVVGAVVVVGILDSSRDLRVVVAVLIIMALEILVDGISRKRTGRRPMDFRNKLIDKVLAVSAITFMFLLDFVFINIAHDPSTVQWWIEWTPFTKAAIAWVGMMDFLRGIAHIDRARKGMSSVLPPIVMGGVRVVQGAFGVLDDENSPDGRTYKRRVTDKVKPEQIKAIAEGTVEPREVLEELKSEGER